MCAVVLFGVLQLWHALSSQCLERASLELQALMATHRLRLLTDGVWISYVSHICACWILSPREDGMQLQSIENDAGIAVYKGRLRNAVLRHVAYAELAGYVVLWAGMWG